MGIALCIVAACSYPTKYAGIDLTPGAADPQIQSLASRALAGSKHAQLELGIRYEQGDGVPVDLNQAQKLYAQAASDTPIRHTIYVPDGGGVRAETAYAGVNEGLVAAQSRLSSGREASGSQLGEALDELRPIAVTLFDVLAIENASKDSWWQYMLAARLQEGRLGGPNPVLEDELYKLSASKSDLSRPASAPDSSPPLDASRHELWLRGQDRASAEGKADQADVTISQFESLDPYSQIEILRKLVNASNGGNSLFASQKDSHFGTILNRFPYRYFERVRHLKRKDMLQSLDPALYLFMCQTFSAQAKSTSECESEESLALLDGLLRYQVLMERCRLNLSITSNRINPEFLRKCVNTGNLFDPSPVLMPWTRDLIWSLWGVLSRNENSLRELSELRSTIDENDAKYYREVEFEKYIPKSKPTATLFIPAILIAKKNTVSNNPNSRWRSSGSIYISLDRIRWWNYFCRELRRSRRAESAKGPSEDQDPKIFEEILCSKMF